MSDDLRDFPRSGGGWTHVEANGVRFMAPAQVAEVPAGTDVWSLRQFQDDTTGLVISVYLRRTALAGSTGLEGLARAALGEVAAEATVVIAQHDRWEISGLTAQRDPSTRRVVVLRHPSGGAVVIEITRPESMAGLADTVESVAASAVIC